MKYRLILLLMALIMTGCVSELSITDSVDKTLSKASPNPLDLMYNNTDSGAAISENKTASGSTNINLKKETPMPSSQPAEKIAANEVLLKTSKGDIKLKLYPNDAPNTVANFVTKAKKDYYKNLTFHRVEDWVIQGGDPLGNGTGGGKMNAEYNKLTFKTGSLGVARGMDKAINNDSQFFICTTDCGFLTENYTNFGEVIEGMDVAKKIAIGDKILGLEIVK